VGVALAVIAGLFVIAIINAAQAVFISAVYHQLNGTDVSIISNESVDELFAPKTPKKLW
jgi:hypothetical protein